MALVTRTVPSHYVYSNMGGRYPISLRCTFDDTPVSREIALAHLELFAPKGLIVVARGRGPRGGLLKPQFLRSGEHIPNMDKRALWFIVQRTEFKMPLKVTVPNSPQAVRELMAVINALGRGLNV